MKKIISLVVLILIVFGSGYELGIYVSYKYGPGHVFKTKRGMCPTGDLFNCGYDEIREVVFGNWLIWFDNNNPTEYIYINDVKNGTDYRISRSHDKNSLSDLRVSRQHYDILLMRDINSSGKYEFIVYSSEKESEKYYVSKDFDMDGIIDEKYIRNYAEER